MITYKQQFDKLTSAYIRGEVDPLENCACFVGNLLNRNTQWCSVRGSSFGHVSVLKNHPLYLSAVQCIEDNSDGFYTPQDIVDLEKTFLDTIREEGYSRHRTAFLTNIHDKIKAWISLDNDEEDCLFIGFEKTLELLRKIHESKGEVIDAAPVFEKRKPIAYVQ